MNITNKEILDYLSQDKKQYENLLENVIQAKLNKNREFNQSAGSLTKAAIKMNNNTI